MCFTIGNILNSVTQLIMSLWTFPKDMPYRKEFTLTMKENTKGFKFWDWGAVCDAETLDRRVCCPCICGKKYSIKANPLMKTKTIKEAFNEQFKDIYTQILIAQKESNVYTLVVPPIESPIQKKCPVTVM